MMLLGLWMLEYSLASEMECLYSHPTQRFYECTTINFKLENRNEVIDSVKGQHLSGKDNIKVHGLKIMFSKNKFLSSDIFKMFPNLKEFIVMYFSVEIIQQGNFNGAQHLNYILMNNNLLTQLTDNIFSGASNLIWIDMRMNQINSISNKSFSGLTKLKRLYLDHNFLSSLPKGIFDDLINLQNVSFNGNILKSLDGNLFKNNLKITHISFSNNQLSVIGSDLMTHIKSLENVNFHNNPCISMSFDKSENNNGLFNDITKCTESNKPKSKLEVAESEINLLNKNITNLIMSLMEQQEENRRLKQNDESSKQAMTKVNEELEKSKFAFKCFLKITKIYFNKCINLC